jgi:hypothetical protein
VRFDIVVAAQAAAACAPDPVGSPGVAVGAIEGAGDKTDGWLAAGGAPLAEDGEVTEDGRVADSGGASECGAVAECSEVPAQPASASAVIVVIALTSSRR